MPTVKTVGVCFGARPSARAQEGQLEGPSATLGVGPFCFCTCCYRFCYRVSTVPANRRLTSLVGDAQPCSSWRRVGLLVARRQDRHGLLG